MPHFCAAINCGNSSHKNGDISFFRFPSDVKRCKKWVINTRRGDLDDKTPDQLRKNYALCSSHFEDSQFANVLHKRLNWNAVPTLFDVPNPPPIIGCTRKLPFRRRTEMASALRAKQGVTSKDVPSLSLSVETDCKNTGGSTTETGSNAEKVTAAPLPKVDQPPSVPIEIGPRDTPVNKRKTDCETTTATSETGSNVEKATAAPRLKQPLLIFKIRPSDTPVKKQKMDCVTTAATTEAVSPLMEAAARLLNVNKQMLVPLTITSPPTPVLRIIKLMPKVGQLQSPLNKMIYKKVMFKPAVVNTQPTKLIRPVQAILAAPATYKAMPDITAQSTHPTATPLRMVCGSLKQTELQSTAITSTPTGGFVREATAAVPNVAQRVSVSRVNKPPETPAEKKLKQKLHKMYSQMWRKNRKIEALKRKISETPPESTRPHQSVEAILAAAKRFLTPVQLSLLRAQLLNSQKEKNGYRWSTSDKIFGLQLLYKSSAAFRFVSQHLALPSEGTLRRFVSETLGSPDSELTPEASIPPADLETDDNHPE